VNKTFVLSCCSVLKKYIKHESRETELEQLILLQSLSTSLKIFLEKNAHNIMPITLYYTDER